MNQPTSPGERRKILVVDDNEMVCLLLSEVLQDEGYDVTTVMRGEDALEELEKNSYPLVLLDLVLPGIRGIQVLKELKQNAPRTEAIMITSHGSMETAVEAMRLGAADYLSKPFDDLDQVTSLVRATLEKYTEKEAREQQEQLRKADHQQLQDAVRQLSKLQEINLALGAAKDAAELQRLTVALAGRELGAQRVSLLLVNPHNGELELADAIGFETETEDKDCRMPGKGIAGWVLQKGKALLLKDGKPQDSETEQQPQGYRTDSFISVPLQPSSKASEGLEVLGVLNICSKKDDTSFTETDLHFATMLAEQCGVRLENYLALNHHLKEHSLEAIRAFAVMMEAKDHTTGEHGDSILRHADAVSEALGLNASQREQIRYGAILHDTGKVGIPEAILTKPGKLTDEEFEVIKSHPRLGADILRGVTFLAPVIPIIEAHHERWDGRGYPQGLSGEAIPLGARIVSVLDSFDAMMADRPYRKSVGTEKAVSELRREAGQQFDPKVVEAFIGVLNKGEVTPGPKHP